MADTIVAPATPLVKSAVGIVRMSGENAWEIANKIFHAKKSPADMPRTLVLGEFSWERIKDRAFCVYYKAPFTYTGEDMVEFQIHGSPVLMQGVIAACTANGARIARNGEFTRRAFLNGKMELGEAEGVLEMINAQSEAAVAAAYRLMRGDLAKTLKETEDKLQKTVALLSASIDYPEEMEEDARREGKQSMQEAVATIGNLLKDAKPRLLHEGAVLVLCGLPNVGKSSLMNAFLAEERAIVTEVAGTTRDTLEENFELNGYRIRLVDTAGIRDTVDTVEKIGVARAKRAIEGGDIILFLSDSSEEESVEERALFEEMPPQKTVRVFTKSDLPAVRKGEFSLSVKTGEGLTQLKQEIIDRLHLNAGDGGLTRERHAESLRRAEAALKEGLSTFDETPIDCILVDLLSALNALAEVTGSDVTEDIIDRVFQEFCVGK